MRPAAELLTELNRSGITLAVTAGQLRATPGSALTAELRAEIAAQKPALLAILAQTPAAEPAFTGQQPANTSTAAPRKLANVTQPAPNVTQPGLSVTPQPATSVTPEPLDPADFTALRQVLETTGRFVPAPPDPPWQDPRPDLTADRSRWWLLLEAGYRLDGQDPNGLYSALFGLRCCGARLELANAATWGARPEDPPPTYRLVRGEELSEAEYADLRQRYLVPHRQALTRLLSAPSAAQLAHPQTAAAAKTTGKTPEKDRPGAALQAPLTGRAAAAAAQPAPRKNGAQQQPAAQPALLAAERRPEPTPLQGGDW